MTERCGMPAGQSSNPLKAWFDAHTAGAGVWKWEHYFDVYHQWFAKFRGKPVNVCEVGVYSGGSLEMWRDYFGPQAMIYGVDIEVACKQYEKDGIRIFIGDQGDRGFWKNFKAAVPRLDILIDDGSHEAAHQIITAEEMLPHLAPGGVYLCEDIHGTGHGFNDFTAWASRSLNENIPVPGCEVISFRPSPFQREIASVHVYPYVTVIEKNLAPVEMFRAPAHGSDWVQFGK